MTSYLADTNILVRLASKGTSEHALVLVAIQRLVTAGVTIAITAQNIVEFWSVATRPVAVNGLGLNPAQAEFETQSFLSRFTLLEDIPEIFESWLNLVTRHEVKGKQVHDARLVAAMQAHELSHLLTLNTKDFERYPEITAVHPSKVGK